jgi:tocopherol cyclase
VIGDRAFRFVEHLDRAYRRTGANLPLGDPTASHGAEMEGYFWRITDVPGGRVLVILCGVNRHRDGDWATVAIAAHPGGFVRSAVVPNASARTDRFHVVAGDGVFEADHDGVRVDLGRDARADVSLHHRVTWPRLVGAGGLFATLPSLGQYWHPHVLGGQARGDVAVGGERWLLDGADVYAEKNWGAGFPDRWWWGQAQGFERPDVCVAFGGGVLTAGPVSLSVGGVVVRIGANVIRLAPPLSRVRSSADGESWEVHATGHGCRVRITGRGLHEPHVLPVPIPAERRNADTDLEHLAGAMSVEVKGRIDYRGETRLAGLEIGHRPTSRG